MLDDLWIIIRILIFMTGVSVFSFLSVVIYRVPLHISFATGRSMCPCCKKTLRGIDMVPVLNWFILKGRCRYCKEPIPFRYPFVELLGGCAALLSVRCYGFCFQTVTVFGFLCMMTVISFVDIDTMEIPNGFIIGVFLTAIVSIFTFIEISLFERAIGLFSVSVPLLLITLAAPGSFGGGDIKLMAAGGLFLGWKLSMLSFFCAVLIGGVYVIYLLASGKKGKKDYFAFGPFLCIGMTIALFWGNMILKWYM